MGSDEGMPKGSTAVRFRVSWPRAQIFDPNPNLDQAPYCLAGDANDSRDWRSLPYDPPLDFSTRVADKLDFAFGWYFERKGSFDGEQFCDIDSRIVQLTLDSLVPRYKLPPVDLERLHRPKNTLLRVHCFLHDSGLHLEKSEP